MLNAHGVSPPRGKGSTNRTSRRCNFTEGEEGREGDACMGWSTLQEVQTTPTRNSEVYEQGVKLRSGTRFASNFFQRLLRFRNVAVMVGAARRAQTATKLCVSPLGLATLSSLDSQSIRTCLNHVSKCRLSQTGNNYVHEHFSSMPIQS